MRRAAPRRRATAWPWRWTRPATPGDFRPNRSRPGTNFRCRVSYSLIDLQSGKTLTAGQEPVSVSYNAMNDPYAGLVAQQDGQKRAAAEAAQRIRIALASYFAKRGEAR